MCGEIAGAGKGKARLGKARIRTSKARQGKGKAKKGKVDPITRTVVRWLR